MDVGEVVDFYPPEAKTHQTHCRAEVVKVTPKCVRLRYESPSGVIERLARQTSVIAGQAQMFGEV